MNPIVLLLLSLVPILADIVPPESEEDPPSPPTGKLATEKKKPEFIDGKTAPERIEAARKFWSTVPVTYYNKIKGDTGTIAARLLKCKAENDTAAIPKLLEDWRFCVEHVYRTDRRVNLNPFFKINLVYSYAICRGQVAFPEIISRTTRDYVALSGHKVFTGYNAMNYELMKDGSGFIAAEIWPDLKDADGLNAGQIKEATQARLFQYFDQIVHGKNPEYGASIYLGADLVAVKMLVDCAQDPEMRKRATMTLDAMFLQIACAWQDGYYVTPISRAKGWPNGNTCPDNMETTASIAWLYFGGLRPINPGTIPYWFLLPDGPGSPPAYHPPDLVCAIAQDRTLPFTHSGTIGNICKYTIHHGPAGTYALASQWEGYNPHPNASGHFKELFRTNLKWVSPLPSSTFSPRQENDATPYTNGIQGHVANGFLLGENVYSRALQEEGTAIGICAVPQDYPFYVSYAPFTKQGAIHARLEADGWVFCHGGTVLFAFRYLQPSFWMAPDSPRGGAGIHLNYDILESDARNNGWILETLPASRVHGASETEQLKNFSELIRGKTVIDSGGINHSIPSFSFTSLSGKKLTLGWFDKEGHATTLVDGRPLDYSSFPLLGNPWVNQPSGSDTLLLTHGGSSLKYDFKNWTVAEEKPPQVK